jgi:LysM repeat protein
MEQKKEIHQVASGETLSSIATLEAVDLDALAKLNGIKNINFIRKGQVLRLPPERLREAPKAQPAKPAADASGKKPTVTPVSEQTEEWELFKVKMTTPWLDELLANLHTQAANEHVQIAGQVPMPVQSTLPTYTPVPPQQSGSLTPQTIEQVKQAFKTKLGIEPHVVQFGGVKMTQNEKKQIGASVALCEMDSNGFSSINEDQEFVGKKYGKHGIETDTYSRIVHVGLSYGMIQFAQDVGALGKVLKKMKERNPSKFINIFGGGDSGISDSLVTLTTTGRPDLANNAEIPLSGLDYWKHS